MATQSLTLGQMGSSNGDWFPRQEINSVFVTGAAKAYLIYLAIAGHGLVNFRVSTNKRNTAGLDGGPEMSAAWKKSPIAIQLNNGRSSISFAGPTAIGNVFPDSSEPYTYIAKSDPAYDTWINETRSNNLSVTLTINDIAVQPLHAKATLTGGLKGSIKVKGQTGKPPAARGKATLSGGLKGSISANGQTGAIPPLRGKVKLTGGLKGEIDATGSIFTAPPIRGKATLTGGLAGEIVADGQRGPIPPLRAKAALSGGLAGSIRSKATLGVPPPTRGKATLSGGLVGRIHSLGQATSVPIEEQVPNQHYTLLSVFFAGVRLGDHEYTEKDNLHIWTGPDEVYLTEDEKILLDKPADPGINFITFISTKRALAMGAIEYRSDVPDRRLEIVLAFDQSDTAARTVIRQDLGSPLCRFDVIYSKDRGDTWAFAPARQVGRLSSPRIEQGQYRFELEVGISGLVRNLTETYGDDRQRQRIIGYDDEGNPIRNTDDKSMRYLEAMEAGYPSAFPFGFRPAEPLKAEES